eukprot:TRINITY_DN45942_c0_g1_i1.p1 TRINITY_DN45942_c0_g1~~TRINITY_DN45942_c0_g1_i1.p1  ORF type:complete len:394 (-),score=73.89 TRINITY_DN45942_c0_g1_i1:201-1382(-)
MGSGASKKSWKRQHWVTSNKEDPVDGEAYTEIYPVWSIAITKNQRQLAAATSENVIVLWCLVDLKELISLKGHADTIWKVSYSPDDSLLASASSDGTVRLWEVYNGMPVMILPRRHAAWVSSMAWTPDSARLATGGADCRIILWDAMEAANAARDLLAEKQMGEDADPEELLKISEEAAEACLPLLYWQGHEKSIVELQFAQSDPKQLVSIGREGTLAVWDAETGQLDCRLQGHIGTMTAMSVHPLNEEIIATGGEDHTVRIWDLRDIEPGTNAAARSREKPMGYNLQHFTLKGHEEGVTVVRFSKDGRLLASGSKDCEVRIWNPDLNGPTLNAKFTAADAWIKDLQWTNDQTHLYSAANDGHIFAFAVPSAYHIKMEKVKKNKKKKADKYKE